MKQVLLLLTAIFLPSCNEREPDRFYLHCQGNTIDERSSPHTATRFENFMRIDLADNAVFTLASDGYRPVCGLSCNTEINDETISWIETDVDGRATSKFVYVIDRSTGRLESQGFIEFSDGTSDCGLFLSNKGALI